MYVVVLLTFVGIKPIYAASYTESKTSVSQSPLPKNCIDAMERVIKAEQNLVNRWNEVVDKAILANDKASVSVQEMLNFGQTTASAVFETKEATSYTLMYAAALGSVVTEYIRNTEYLLQHCRIRSK